jgi:hypothetical protein
MSLSILVWGPAAEGERSMSGRRLPAGWVWTCGCGGSGVGLADEDAADEAAALHEEHHRRLQLAARPTTINNPERAS